MGNGELSRCRQPARSLSLAGTPVLLLQLAGHAKPEGVGGGVRGARGVSGVSYFENPRFIREDGETDE